MPNYQTNVIGRRAIINISYELESDAVYMESAILRKIEDIVLWDTLGVMLELIDYDVKRNGKTIYVLMQWKTPDEAKAFIEAWQSLWTQN